MKKSGSLREGETELAREGREGERERRRARRERRTALPGPVERGSRLRAM